MNSASDLLNEVARNYEEGASGPFIGYLPQSPELTNSRGLSRSTVRQDHLAQFLGESLREIRGQGNCTETIKLPKIFDSEIDVLASC